VNRSTGNAATMLSNYRSLSRIEVPTWRFYEHLDDPIHRFADRVDRGVYRYARGQRVDSHPPAARSNFTRYAFRVRKERYVAVPGSNVSL
jgi:hypothetical protein